MLTKPLPKIFGWLGAIIAIVPSVYEAYQKGGLLAAALAVIAAIGATTTLLSHSATGTGGTPTNP